MLQFKFNARLTEAIIQLCKMHDVRIVLLSGLDVSMFFGTGKSSTTHVSGLVVLEATSIAFSAGLYVRE